MPKDKKPTTAVVPRRSAERWMREEALRNAEVAYLTDRQQRPLEYWWEALCSQVISLQSYSRRARWGRWVTRREAFWQGARDQFLREAMTRIVSDQIAELGQLEQVRADTLEMLRPEIIGGKKIYRVRPGTREGMTGALIKVDRRIDDKREALLSRIEPQLAAQEGISAVSSNFTPEEWRKMARFVLEQRQADQQQRLLEGAQDGDRPRASVEESAQQESGEEDDESQEEDS